LQLSIYKRKGKIPLMSHEIKKKVFRLFEMFSAESLLLKKFRNPRNLKEKSFLNLLKNFVSCKKELDVVSIFS
jgi:hypothetical protein